MRLAFFGALSCCGLVLAGCSSTGSGASATAAEPFALADGTYRAEFPRSGCGTMTISGNGQDIAYAYGKCGSAPDFNIGGRFDGKTIRLGAATYRLSDVTEQALTGRWRLRNYTARITFERL